MTEWDVYCAVCGGPFRSPEFSRKSRTRRFWRRRQREAEARRAEGLSDDESVRVSSEEDNDESLSEWSEEKSYDPDVITEEDAEWVSELHVLGFNPNAQGTSNAFISGPGTYTDYGMVQVDPGDDPNFVGEDEELPCYGSDEDSDREPVFPFHLCCYQLLAKFLTGSFDHAELDKDLMYRTMQKLSPSYGRSLELDYGYSSRGDWQHWDSVAGEEYVVVHPTPAGIPRLKDKLTKFIVTRRFTHIASAIDIGYRITNDPFKKVPYDILCKILGDVPTKSVVRLANVSWYVHSALRHNDSFWKQRLRSSMSWFFELEDLMSEFDIFQDRDPKILCLWLDKVTTPRKFVRHPLMPLANRRRIWSVCEKIADVYLAQWREQEDPDLSPGEKILRSNSICDYMPVVSYPHPTQKPMTRRSFWVKSWDEIYAEAKKIETFWDNDGALVGLSIALESQGRNLFGKDDSSSGITRQSTKIDKNDWVVGFVLHIPKMTLRFPEPSTSPKGITVICKSGIRKHFGQTEKEHPKRPLLAAEGWHIVGLCGQTGNIEDNEQISRLGLLQTRKPRLSDHTDSSDEESYPELPQLERWLWSNDSLEQLGQSIWDRPGLRMILGVDEDGDEYDDEDEFWNVQPYFHRDVVPQEALIWARDKAELLGLRRISVHQSVWGKGDEDNNNGSENEDEGRMKEYAITEISAELSSEFHPVRRIIGEMEGLLSQGKIQGDRNGDSNSDNGNGGHSTMSVDMDVTTEKQRGDYVHFDIDGAGGEIIEEILVEYDVVPNAFKLRTNRGREVHWGKSAVRDWKSIKALEDETLIGMVITWAEPKDSEKEDSDDESPVLLKITNIAGLAARLG